MTAAHAPHLSTGTSVSFTFEGCRLAGSLHRPDRTTADLPAVVLFNQGPVDRGGAHRLYIKLACRLTSLGFPVFRFDARGIGESDGLFDGEGEAPLSVPMAYGLIQRGAWVPDANAAIEFLRQSHGIERVVLGGLCGGAATAFLAGARHPAVAAMFGIGTPLTFTASTRRVSDMPQALIEQDTWDYLRKLFKPAAWKRFLSFQTDYPTLASVLATRIRRRLNPKWAEAGPSNDDDKVNGRLVEAINEAVRGRKPVLMVYSENDYLWHEFNEQSARFGARERLPMDLVTIPDANHTLTEEPWQESLFNALTKWLTANVPIGAGQGRRA